MVQLKVNAAKSRESAMNMEPVNHQPISEENIYICTTVVNGSVVGEKQPLPEDVVGPNEGPLVCLY